MPSDLIEQLPGLLNLPDLIIIAAVLVNMILGFRRGFFGALSGLVGRAGRCLRRGARRSALCSALGRHPDRGPGL